MISKIKNFNNKFQHRIIDLSSSIIENPISKYFKLISKNKVLLIYEKLFGKVKSLFIKIIYYDGTVLRETEIKHIGYMVTYAHYDRNIVVAFRRSKKDYIIQRYDIMNLKMEKEFFTDFEVNRILINEDRIFLFRDNEPYIYEYDHEFKFRQGIGQMNKEKKPFYIKGTIFSINNDKIYIKYENSIRILNKESGELMCSFNVSNLKGSTTIYLDYHKEKYIVFNGYNKISYYNHKGDLLFQNKLRENDIFDEFQYTTSGHFGFVSFFLFNFVIFLLI